MPNVSPRHITPNVPSSSHASLILGSVLLALVLGNGIALFKSKRIIPPKSPQDFSSIHLPTMQATPVVIKEDDTEDSDENNKYFDDPIPASDPVSQETEKPEEETENAKNIALIIKHATKDPNWSSYSKQVQGCLATQVVTNPELDYSSTVQRCKNYYDE